MKATLLISGILIAFSLVARADELPKNKLLQMYRIYYLPFSLSFQEGQSKDDILPFVLNSNGDKSRLLLPEELKALDSKYEEARFEWRKKSLLLTTPVPDEQTVHISNRLTSHSLSADRSVVERLSLSDRMELNRLLKGVGVDEKPRVTQKLFVRTLLSESDKEKFNFFIVGPNWCESSKEYRLLLEAYFKDVEGSKLSLHNVVLQDPKQAIFDSVSLKELFPNAQKYSHESVPRFLAAEFKDGKLTLWEEADALEELHERFLAPHKGYLDSIVPFLKTPKAIGASFINF